MENAVDTMKESPVTTTPQEKRVTVKGLLEEGSIRKRFEEVLGKKAPGFISSIISAVNSNRKLLEADPMSVVQAAAVAASLDLPINPSLGFAHIVPYSGQAQFQMGWRGFVQLGMRTGQYKTINVTSVKEGELVSHNKFTGEMIFDESKKTSDKIVGYAAYFRLLNGFEKFLYMTVEETEAHGKKYSKTYNMATGMWKKDAEAMSLKTVLKMLLSKYGILSIDMQAAIQADQAVVTTSGEYVYADAPDVVEMPETNSLKEKLQNRQRVADKAEADSHVCVGDPPDLSVIIELAPGPCPDNPETTYTIEHCAACAKRIGCPIFIPGTAPDTKAGV
jgi:recombination protein RecT